MPDPIPPYGYEQDVEPAPVQAAAADQPAPPAAPANLQSQGAYSAAQRSGKFYNRYEICIRIQRQTGLKGAPAAGPAGTPQAVMRQNGGWAKKTITWRAERYNAPPALPFWDTGDVNDVLEYWDIAGLNPVPQQFPQDDGTHYLFAVRGIYIYIMQIPPGDGDPFPLPTTAVVTTPAGNFRLGPNVWDRTLIPSLTPAGPPGAGQATPVTW